MEQQIAVPTSREQLWALLAEAAEIEHHLMCCYLYAAFSLKESTGEDLSEAEFDAVERWRREILSVSVEEMGHLAIVCNILSALGAPAHLVHQNFPIPPGYHPAGVVVKLAPFNRQTLAHFVYLERPDDAEVQDGEGFEPPQHYSRALGMDRLMTACTDYETVGELYRSVSAGLQRLSESMGERRLFEGNPEHQLDADGARLPGLKTVRCLTTALEAIDAIVRQGEGADSCTGDSHYQRFLRIGREYDALLASRPEFRPARMSAHNPVMRPPPTPQGRLWISEEPAAALLDLGNALYNHCLRCVSLAYGDVGRDAKSTLVSAGVDLMHLLTPVAARLGTLPANPSMPQATAGLSFATIRSSAALMGEAGSVDILVERLHEIGERCERLMDMHPKEAGLLEATRAGTQRLANRLTAQAERCRREEASTRAEADSVQIPEVRAPAASQATQPQRLDNGAELIPGPEVDIVYDGTRCIHARHCVLGLPGVFRANTPGAWIHPDAASVEALVTVAHMCPSGAIAYRRHDGGTEEAPPPVNLIQLRENGPLGVRAHIVLDGVPIGMRAVLCRCGASRQKPLCDGSHNEIHFQATGEPASVESKPLPMRDGPLNVDPEVNGPLVLSGNVEICCGTGRTINRVTSTRLCRCGGSSNKPFCDDTHRRNGFRS
ncbi:CDGSH iron-sulfur domain-containing protein [Lysobacter arenosi]|uniref:CDGSH iron-sulfur domain-containing protein n=1 Tax=Lysobacter arenosi TaxID=2795387 RepID=A0ABX7RCX3_9GAMM|nr:ferritin-like domain-containing protein [Lysobacter arenosi]QSX75870.1 CDGSH iron-sulfur domain-containing protein [Lysobacter arenosi]